MFDHIWSAKCLRVKCLLIADLWGKGDNSILRNALYFKPDYTLIGNCSSLVTRKIINEPIVSVFFKEIGNTRFWFQCT